MSSPGPCRALALLLALVPGWGHVYLGRERTGLVLFSLAAASAFAVVNVVLVAQGPHRLLLGYSCLTLAFFFWFLSLLGAFRLTSPARRRRIEEAKTALLRQGIIAYLKDELDGAQAAFRACLKLDRQDVEALVRLGVVAVRKGKARRARRLLRRAGRLDLEEKWRWEIGRELAALRDGARPAGPSGAARAAAAQPRAEAAPVEEEVK